jgi:hypothetical protein
VILHRAFREAPLDELRPHPASFSEEEERYLARAGHGRGSRAARQLLKELVREWLAAQGREVAAALIEVLPPAGPDPGPPLLRLPEDVAPPACHWHVSLAHSRTHAAALLVVEEDAGRCV